jgi:hypothetical protein
MNRLTIGLAAGLIAGSALTWLLHERLRPGPGAPEEKPQAQSAAPSPSPGGVHLSEEAQRRAGLQVVTLSEQRLSPEIKAYGAVLDPGPLAALAAERSAARAALDASDKEYQRVKLLHDQAQNASAKALDTATAALRHDEVALESAQARLVAAWGTAVAAQADSPAFVRSLVAVDAALARADLPLGASLSSPLLGVSVASLSGRGAAVVVQYLGRAPSVDAHTQGQGLLLLMRSGALPPGTAIVASLAVAGEELVGTLVPASAILRYEGQQYVFLQTADESFRRQEITLERGLAAGWFVREGVKPGDRVVVVGAQQLLSEEQKGQAEEE